MMRERGPNKMFTLSFLIETSTLIGSRTLLLLNDRLIPLSLFHQRSLERN